MDRFQLFVQSRELYRAWYFIKTLSRVLVWNLGIENNRNIEVVIKFKYLNSVKFKEIVFFSSDNFISNFSIWNLFRLIVWIS